MNELMIFNNPEFGEIRTIEEDGKVLFCGSDVAKALGYAKPQNAIDRHCKGALKRGIPHPQSPDKTIEMNFIPEGDIYRLAAKSELPGAERFESWIFDEVLPSIRKHGAYLTPETLEAAILNPDTMIRLCTALKDEQDKRKALEEKQEADRPKVLFADSVAASKTSILVGELSKLLKQNGVDIGQNRLFHWLRSNGFLIRRQGTDYNMPTQRAMEMGLFEIKETSITHADGHTSVNKTPKVTGKGQQYFVNAFLGGK
nr:MAG TPA: repressor domain protein [Caudoviricetes sp.]